MDKKSRKFNIYINIVFQCESEEFPNEYGTISKMKTNLKKAIKDSPEFIMRRYNYDIQEQISEEEQEAYKPDVEETEL